jgi:hypothetical protein
MSGGKTCAREARYRSRRRFREHWFLTVIPMRAHFSPVAHSFFLIYHGAI